MNNRTTNLLLLIVIVLGCYWLWKQPATHGDAEKVKETITALPDKAIDAAAKISNKIEDAKIPEKAGKALENAKEEVKEAGENIKQDFEDARKKDREQQQP